MPAKKSKKTTTKKTSNKKASTKTVNKKVKAAPKKKSAAPKKITKKNTAAKSKAPKKKVAKLSVAKKKRVAKKKEPQISSYKPKKNRRGCRLGKRASRKRFQVCKNVIDSHVPSSHLVRPFPALSESRRAPARDMRFAARP